MRETKNGLFLVSKQGLREEEEKEGEEEEERERSNPRYGFYDFWYGFYMESKDLMVLYGFLGIPNLGFS